MPTQTEMARKHRQRAGVVNYQTSVLGFGVQFPKREQRLKNIIFTIAAFILFASAAFASGITVQELHDRLAEGKDILLVNVSDEAARADVKFDLGGKLIDPYAFLNGDAGLEDHKGDEIVVYDRTGRQSGTTVSVMIARGFTNARSLTGGLLAWIEAYGRTMPTRSPKAASPTVQTPSNVPAVAQEKLLFRSGAANLVEEATGWLSDLIDDEDITTAITEKWSARKDLIGKTRTQILALLLADAKSLITDKAALDTFVKGWNAHASPVVKPPKPSPVPLAPQTPDFSGTWTLNKAASKLTDQFSMAPTQIKIVQAGNDLEVERSSSMVGNEFTVKDKFTLDGKESINPGWSDSQKRSTAVWPADKASLIITTKISMGDNGDMTTVETYRLRGQQFVIETKGSSSFGEVSETLVFDKK